MNRSLPVAALVLLLTTLPIVSGTASAQDGAPGTPDTAVVSVTVGQPGQRQTSLLAKQWERDLRRLVREEIIVLFCDIDPAATPPAAMGYGDRARGASAMRALARAVSLEWQEMNGIQTMCRPQKPAGDDVAEVSKWLLSLDPASRKRMMGGELTTGELPPPAKSLLLKMACSTPDMSFVLLERGDDVNVKLSMKAAVEYTDPATGRTRRRELPGQHSDFPSRPAAPAKPAGAKAAPELPLGKPEPGPLDFGRGAVLTLAEIVKSAEEAFHVHYHLDRRMAQNHYFVNGRMNQAGFDAALERMTAVPPVLIRKTRAAEHGTAREILNRLADAGGKIDLDVESIDVQDFIERKSLSVEELGQGRPGMASFLAGLNLPADAKVRLIAAPELTIGTQGFHQTSAGSATTGGVPVPVMMANRTVISLE